MNPVETFESLYPYFDGVGEGIAVLDREGTLVSLNRTAARLLGSTGAHPAPDRFEELADAFTPSGESIPAEERPGRLAVDGRFVRSFELALRPPGAAEAHAVEVSTAPIQNAGGETTHILLTCREITTQNRLDESRARLAAIVESSEDAIIGKDLDGTVTAWNKGAEKLFGYSAREMIGQSIRRILVPGAEREEDEILARIARGEIVEHSHRQRRKKSGETVEVSVTVSPIRNGRGEIIGASKIARDITAAERAADALRASERRLTGILDSAMDAIITVDEQQRILLFNSAAESIFLCSQAEAVGSSIDRFIPARFRSFHAQHIRNFARTGMTSRAMGELGSLWAMRSNGDEFEIEASISQVEAQGRKLFTVILRDISDRKMAEESLREQAQLLRVSQMIARDLDDRIVFWPEGAQKMYGFTDEEALGTISHELFHTRFPEPFEDIERTLYSTGRWEGELAHRRRDGETIVVSSAWILYRDRDGRPTRILESLVDVTERRRAEEKLRQSEERFSLAFKSSPVPIVITTVEEGRGIDANDALCKMLGYELDEVVIGHELGMTVTAEGVETEEQLDFLRRKGCDRAQGFLFSRPLPLPSINEWLKSRHARGAHA